MSSPPAASRIGKAAHAVLTLAATGARCPRAARRMVQVRREKLTYLSFAALSDLAGAMHGMERDGIPGIVIEAGTALGGSAIVIAAAKRPARPMRVYDTFAMIPPPTGHDSADVHQRYAEITAGASVGLAGEKYYGYRDDLLGEVTASFARNDVPVDTASVTLVPGLFQDTLVGDEPVALAHLDGDWFASTMTCLERIGPRLVPGGRLVIDDYDAWSGCRDAVDQYFRGRPGFRREARQRLHIVKE